MKKKNQLSTPGTHLYYKDRTVWFSVCHERESRYTGHNRAKRDTQSHSRAYTLWQDLGMHLPWGQKVTGEGYAVIKCAAGVSMQVDITG